MTTNDKTPMGLKHCLHYDMIVDYNADDLFSKQIIDAYRDSVFKFDSNNPEELEHIKLFDQYLYNYINHNKCFKKIQNYFTKNPSCYDDITNVFMRLSSEYNDSLIKEVCNSKWV